MSGSLPTVMTTAGLQPQAPASLLAQLLALVQATTPGYTVLPGGLIEDISSTDVAAISLIDQARVDLVNSLTPYGANLFLLNQLAQIYGVVPGVDTNTSVYVVFSGTPSFVISSGFTVSDGTYQYVVQDTSIINTGGTSAPVYCVAVLPGSWPVPQGTVNQIVTSVPTGITLTVTNPTAGTASLGPQTNEDYRAQVLQAGVATSLGCVTQLKMALQNIPGVQQRLISVRNIPGSGWEIIVGGGDPNAVANAIFTSLFELSNIIGSVMGVTGVTQANPGVVTTDLNHGYATGQVVTFSGVGGMTELNTGNYTVTVLSPTTFSIGVNTSAYTIYTTGGVVSPNLRNVTATINDYPDIYTVTFVNPPAQTVNISLTWNTTAAGIVPPAAVAQLGQTALVNYINSIPVGAALNLFELQNVFQAAVAPVLPTPLLTRMVFAISINGVGVSPGSGTGIFASDPESYFTTTAADISVVQG